MSKKQWWLVGFGIFTVIAGGLVAYGVLTHEEPGFRRPEVSWNQSDFPLQVQAIPYAVADGRQKAAREATKSAIQEVNGRLGFDAYRYNDSESAQVHITIGVPQNTGLDVPADFDGVTAKGAGGAFRLNLYPGGQRWKDCQVLTSNTGTTGALHVVLYQNLGACLGLDYDDYAASIMYPVLKEWDGVSFPPRISDWDRDLIRERYAP